MCACMVYGTYEPFCVAPAAAMGAPDSGCASLRAMPAALLSALILLTTLHVPLERYVLPNGLVVILHEDHRLPNVVVDLTFHVGSKDEKPGRTGFAHLFEHLMFMGTKNVPNGTFDNILEGAGGYDNASTNEDYTNYFDTGPS